MSEANKSILEKANLAIAEGENEIFLSYCTEDITWNFVGDQILQGKDAIRKYMEEVYKDPPKFDVKNLIAEDSFVTAIGEISLKNDNGAMVHYSYCDVWEFRDGKMAALTAYVIEL